MFQIAIFLTAIAAGVAVGRIDDVNLGSFIKSPSFSKGKRLLYKIEEPWATTIYCNCKYDPSSKTISTSAECGVKPRPGLSTNGQKRYYRIEAEHVVPANVLCGAAQGWTTHPRECKENNIAPGRSCAERFFPCKYAISDVHNLFPASGGINADRSDKPFTEDFLTPMHQYGPRCPINVGFGNQADAATVTGCVQGLVARVSLYMHESYSQRGLTIGFTAAQIATYKAWNCRWPVSNYECQRNEIANSHQGNYNHVTKAACDNGGLHPTCPRRRLVNATKPNCTVYRRPEVNISEYVSATPDCCGTASPMSPATMRRVDMVSLVCVLLFVLYH